MMMMMMMQESGRVCGQTPWQNSLPVDLLFGPSERRQAFQPRYSSTTTSICQYQHNVNMFSKFQEFRLSLMRLDEEKMDTETLRLLNPKWQGKSYGWVLIVWYQIYLFVSQETLNVHLWVFVHEHPISVKYCSSKSFKVNRFKCNRTPTVTESKEATKSRLSVWGGSPAS